MGVPIGGDMAELRKLARNRRPAPNVVAQRATYGGVSRFRAFVRRHRLGVLSWLGVLLLGAAAGAVGLTLQPEVHGDVGPGVVSIDPAVRAGDTVVELPPLGRLRADSHRGPVGFTVRVDRIDLDQAGQLAGDLVRGTDPATELRNEMEDDLRPLLWRVAVRTLIVAAAGGVLVGLTLPRRRIRYVVASTLGAVGFVAAAGGVAMATFVPSSFDHPEFEGTLAAAPDVVSTVQRHLHDVDAVETRLQALSDRLVGLYQSVEGAGPSSADVTLLHVSDIHSNPVGIELVEETAQRFGVDAIIDTGDVTSFGSSIEQAIVKRIARIPFPYYVIPGNHDRPDIRQALSDAGVRVLDPGIARISGLRILGVGDPVFSADNRIAKRVWDRELVESAADVGELVHRYRPDIVAVHEPYQLTGAYGQFAVGLSGHMHRPKLHYEDGSVLLEGGSAGATGVGALMADEDLPYQMELLQFEDGRLVAVDRLEFRGTAGAFRLERLLIDPDRVTAYPDTETVPVESGPLAPLYRMGQVPR